ncbi:uncharacterized protein LOC131218933 [Magnolia sinica]|uniref:uncharacterized protein LOC131218933 n=1 Tax=Magnolia sinica TaxID=86752 RepID=UPI00265B43F4|nr:uncharacterized protein LOC131218933 [Magnolia sinica]
MPEERNKGTMFKPVNIDEIMSRYKPIAPKPQLLFESHPNDQNTHQSPTISPPRTRAGRPRKRGKTVNSTFTPKNPEPHFKKFSPYASSLLKNTHHDPPPYSFGHGIPGSGLHESPTSSCGGLVALPLPPYACSNMEAMILNCRSETPQEKDLLHKLQTHLSGPDNSGCGTLVTPQPVRPVGSSISVECISGSPSIGFIPPVSKRPEEVEEEVESDALPSIVSDSNNRVRLVNSAYKELVGQPECPWLDSMVGEDGTSRTGPKRICGEVALVLSDSMEVPISSNGFSCRVKIEWASNGHKIFINAPCDVVRLSCESKGYLFTWKFHTNF